MRAGSWGRDDGDLFDGDRVSVWEDETVLGVGGGDGCTTVRMYLMPLKRARKCGSRGTFYVHFATIKKLIWQNVYNTLL